MSVAFDPIADNLLTIPIGQVDLSTEFSDLSVSPTPNPAAVAAKLIDGTYNWHCQGWRAE